MLLGARSVTTGWSYCREIWQQTEYEDINTAWPKRRAAGRPANVPEQAMFTPLLPLLTGQSATSSKAFRFESIGELIFYLSYHQLDPRKFNACFAADIGVE